MLCWNFKCSQTYVNPNFVAFVLCEEFTYHHLLLAQNFRVTTSTSEQHRYYKMAPCYAIVIFIQLFYIGSEICCYYNQVTKEFQCNGIEMIDVKWKVKHPQYTNESPFPLKLRKLKFISYNDPACQVIYWQSYTEKKFLP